MLQLFSKRVALAVLAALIVSAEALAPSTASAEFLQQGPKLVGIGATGIAYQGTSVAVSADGNTAIVGARGDSAYAGAAWIFVRNNGAWAPQGGKLVGTGAIGAAHQGASVAISADGNTVIVGGSADDSFKGAAWIFTRSNGAWSPQGKLVGSGSVGVSSRGAAVALSGDGSTALVGGFADNTGVGAAWVFTRSGGTWTQQGPKLVGIDRVGQSEQGSSVSLSADGNTALVGGQGDNDGYGAAWVFNRNAGAWAPFGNKLVGTGNAGRAGQGGEVALSADGKTAAVGGRSDDFSETTETSMGATWVFAFIGSEWKQQGGKLLGNDSTGGANQGISVSLSGDGDTLIVGGDRDGGGVGAVWIYGRSNGVWTQRREKLTGTGRTGPDTYQGSAVALSADGSTAIVGGPGDNSSAGATWANARLVPHDFGFDGKSDILWRNSAGDISQWMMKGGVATAVSSLGNVATNWSIVGQRDFNADGKSDILWSSSTGDLAMWLMNGTTASTVTSLGNVSTNWSIVGTADMNRNNRGDILWRNTAGDISLWSMLGTSASQIYNLGNVATNWSVVAVADFNGDDRSDILWRDTSGNLAMWVMGAGGSVASVNSLGNIANNWSVAGTADFNGDGKSDVLWRSTSGDIVMWLMNGTSASTVASLGYIGTNWSVASAGDYNGDGKGDILWRSTSGDIVMWLMNGTSASSVASLGNVATNWTIQNVNAN